MLSQHQVPHNKRSNACDPGDPMRAPNFLVIMSDEHNPKVMGCAGHSLVQTPNLDALAARGTYFSSAYTDPNDGRVLARSKLGRGKICGAIGK